MSTNNNDESTEEREENARKLALKMFAVFRNGTLAAKQEIVCDLMFADQIDFIFLLKNKLGDKEFDRIVEVC
jgi:hypothetical protein